MENSLLFSQSPLCPLAVDLISDGQSYYFYMYDLDYENEQLNPHSACWVKNLVPSHDTYDEQCTNHAQPLMPASLIEKEDLNPWQEEDIEIVWSKEGHIAALYHQNQLVCIIPNWADGKEFCGYCANVVENTMLGWKLSDVLDIFEPRFEESKRFWMQEFNGVWSAYHSPYVDDLCKQFGGIDQCFDLHKDQFPSRILITFEQEDTAYAFTVGMGMFAMPNADRYYDDYQSYARCEFAIRIDKSTCDDADCYQLYSMLANLCNYPWEEMDTLADQHIVDIAYLDKDHCILLDDDHYEDALPLSIKQQGVHLTWVVPLDDEDYIALKEDKKSVIDRIIKENRK